ncbi:MAG: hypothetical protein MJK12_12775 [Colwellia sp.]|nr:hypothetical protein [Colwellia sp.]
MNTVKSININNLDNHPVENASFNSWFNIQSVENTQQLSQLYSKICQQHKNEKKWILVINPEDETLEKLTLSRDIDTSKILRVNINKHSLNLTGINKALSKGNCSAVILSDAALKQEDISQLTHSAQQGKTQCIMLKSAITMH